MIDRCVHRLHTAEPARHVVYSSVVQPSSTMIEIVHFPALGRHPYLQASIRYIVEGDGTLRFYCSPQIIRRMSEKRLETLTKHVLPAKLAASSPASDPLPLVVTEIVALLYDMGGSSK
jgi:hypothetical protein